MNLTRTLTYLRGGLYIPIITAVNFRSRSMMADVFCSGSLRGGGAGVRGATESTDSPDCLPILLSISVFYFLVFGSAR